MVKFVRKFKQQPIDRKPGETPVQAAFRKLAENTKYFNEVIKPHLEPEVLNVKKSLIKIAQNMLNFGRRIKIF
ncbi:MAG: hypothetical protein AN484_21260 [Aphanizomenon flos-aquae WA102]|jgi:hypothetical protein|uniref:Transposase n=1 Tax=Aphanizomenon flos-aquae WA102 TaxID=1710896 RepID=A0A1B7WVX7_APHFL|nr:MAG: hypothetical protein AN484_21260 [Aphanizomenon flos-aquae WA102]